MNIGIKFFTKEFFTTECTQRARRVFSYKLGVLRSELYR
jgi:hypothetical protein